MTWSQELTAHEQEFENHGYGQVAMWLTEFGWPRDLLADEPNIRDDVTQAQYLLETYDDLLQLPFVQAPPWFKLRHCEPASPDPPFFTTAASWSTASRSSRRRTPFKLWRRPIRIAEKRSVRRLDAYNARRPRGGRVRSRSRCVNSVW